MNIFKWITCKRFGHKLSTFIGRDYEKNTYQCFRCKKHISSGK